MSEKKDNGANVVGGLLFVAIAIVVLGFCIKSGLKSFSDGERTVSVRGLAEQDIKATTSYINITKRLTGDDPKAVLSQLDAGVEQLRVFLKEQGFDNVEVKNVEFYDNGTFYNVIWEEGKQIRVKQDRYILTQAIRIKVDSVVTTESKLNVLQLAMIQNGISADVYSNYVFPDLNDIKPQLIAESTKNARVAGEQFAKDSDSKLGKIKTASQGQISYEGDGYDADGNGLASVKPYIERVRVVSSVVFFLED